MTAVPSSAHPSGMQKSLRPITILMNSASGAEEKRFMREQIVAALLPMTRNVILIETAPTDDLAKLAQKVVQEAAQRNGIVVAAGGDGTVNTVAAFCCRYDVPLGIIPIGTFNYFARELGIPQDIPSACQIIAKGIHRSVNVAYVNQYLFLNNASFGLYSKVIHQREQAKARFGRFRLVAVFSAIATMLRSQFRVAVKIQAGNTAKVHRTSMVFISNNTFQLNQLDLAWSECARQGKLAVVVLKPVSRLAMASLLVNGFFKNLNKDAHLDIFCADSLTMETKRRTMAVVVDGELVKCTTPLAFRVAPAALKVLVPEVEAPA